MGVVWNPPTNQLRARADLFEMKTIGVEVVRTPLLLHNELYEIADSLGLELYQDLPFEYLRVHSPSADVKGHGPGQEVLQTGKERVQVTAVEPVGHYAVRLRFDDGHDTGLYTWKYLHELGREREPRWQAYLDRLAAAGYAREP